MSESLDIVAFAGIVWTTCRVIIYRLQREWQNLLNSCRVLRLCKIKYRRICSSRFLIHLDNLKVAHFLQNGLCREVHVIATIQNIWNHTEKSVLKIPHTLLEQKTFLLGEKVVASEKSTVPNLFSDCKYRNGRESQVLGHEHVDIRHVARNNEKNNATKPCVFQLLSTL